MRLRGPAVLLLYTALCATPIRPQSQAPGTTGDSVSIFASEIGDADVELFLQGAWKSRASVSSGFALLPGIGLRFPYLYPDFPGGFVFDQHPDLTISLWLQERYFLEAVVTEGYTLNSYVAGYQGKEGEFVQSVRIGTKDIEISPYPYMDFPGSARTSPGVSARFQTERGRHEFLLRYDPSLPAVKTFLGSNEVHDRRIDPSSFLRGRFFLLPDTGLDFLEIYVEDSAGSHRDGQGRRYRAATPAEASFSTAAGTIALAAAPRGRILVYYEKAGRPVGDPALGRGALPGYSDSGNPGAGPFVVDPLAAGRDFDWGANYMGAGLAGRRVALSNGRACLLLYTPGAFSPFESLAYYEGAGWSAASSVDIVSRGGSAPLSFDPPLTPTYDEANAVLRIVGESLDPRAFTSRYPFARAAPLLYGPDLRLPAGATDFEILSRTLTAVRAFTLPEDFIPGSVEIRRNGRPETAFSVDETNRIVSFAVQPLPSELIEISYRTYSAQGVGGNLVVGAGNTFLLSDEITARLAAGLRWNVARGSFSTAPDDHPGRLALSGSLSYRGPGLEWDADAVVAYTNPDTSGRLRLLGMNRSELEFPITTSTLRPSSPPEPSPLSAALSPVPGPPAASELTQDRRGRLIHRNHETRDLLGSVSLSAYDTSPLPAAFAYESGSIPGPYIAGGGSDGPSRVLVMEYDIAAGERWVGAEILAPRSAEINDLSSATALRFRYRVVNASGSAAHLVAQVGSGGEDLDADGHLDEELSELSRGFEFSHQGSILFIGGGQDGSGNGVRDSEDADRNGILDREETALMNSWNVPPSSAVAAGGWQSFRVPLSAQERARLSNTRSVRFLLYAASGAAQGRIVIGDVVLEGSGFAVAALAEGGEVSVREVTEVSGHGVIMPAGGAGGLLERMDSETVRLFNEGTAQGVAEVSWKETTVWNPTPPDTRRWDIVRQTVRVPPGRYRTLVLYLRLVPDGSSDPGEFRLSYLDENSRGVIQDITLPGDNRWRRLAIDMADARASLDGVELAERPRIDTDHGPLSRFSLALIGGPAAGVLYIDEVHLADTLDSIGAGGSFAVRYRRDGPLLEAAGRTILANPRLSQSGSLSSQGLIDTRVAEEPAFSYNSVSGAGVDILGFLGIDGEFGAAGNNDRTDLRGSHSLIFPLNVPALRMRERFTRDYRRQSPSMSRELSIALAPENLPSVDTLWSASVVERRLSQFWRLAASGSAAAEHRISAHIEFGRTARAYDLADASYLECWTHGFSLLYPSEKGLAAERRGGLELHQEFSGAPLGFQSSLDLSFRSAPEVDGRRSARAGLALGLPLRFNTGGVNAWNLSFNYRRSYEGVAASASECFQTDAEEFAAGLLQQTYLFTSLPFVELFAPAESGSFIPDSRGAVEARYRPEFEIAYERRIGSLPLDLLLPSRVEAVLSRRLKRQEETVSSGGEYSLRLTNQAVNLFGSVGSLPLTDLFYSDEYRFVSAATVVVTDDEPAWRLEALQSLSFFDRDENSLVWDSALNIGLAAQNTVRAKASLSWLRYSPALSDFGLDIVRQAIASGARYLHTSGLEGEFASENQRFSLSLMHETAFIIPARGSIRAELRAALASEPFAAPGKEDRAWFFGFLAAVSAQFTF